MRILPIICALATGALLTVSRQAAAAVDVQVDLSTQTMRVTDRGQTYEWPVSTARAGYVTPSGVYHPTSLQVMHYSRKYQMSPMPHSIFFKGGYAIHGTYETGSIGRPASHGCVRLSPAHAALLFKLVQADGARIAISGSPPRSRVAIDRVRRSRPESVGAVRARARAYAPAAPATYYYYTYGYPTYDDGYRWPQQSPW